MSTMHSLLEAKPLKCNYLVAGPEFREEEGHGHVSYIQGFLQFMRTYLVWDFLHPRLNQTY